MIFCKIACMSFFHSYRLSLLINGIIIENRRKNMSFVSYLINGLSLGSVYALIALGYTMVYGIAKMLNFAHGDVIMIGGYVALLSMTNAGLSPLFLEMLHLLWLYLLPPSVSVICCKTLHFYFSVLTHRPSHQLFHGRDCLLQEES